MVDQIESQRRNILQSNLFALCMPSKQSPPMCSRTALNRQFEPEKVVAKISALQHYAQILEPHNQSKILEAENSILSAKKKNDQLKKELKQLKSKYKQSDEDSLEELPMKEVYQQADIAPLESQVPVSKSVNTALNRWNNLIKHAHETSIQQTAKPSTIHKKLLHNIITSWKKWAHARVKLKRAIRLLRRVHKQVRIKRIFDAWKSLTIDKTVPTTHDPSILAQAIKQNIKEQTALLKKMEQKSTQKRPASAPKKLKVKR